MPEMVARENGEGTADVIKEWLANKDQDLRERDGDGGSGSGTERKSSSAGCWTAWRTRSENHCTLSSRSTTPSIHSRHAAPLPQQNLHLHWANARSTHLQPPDAIPLQMTRYQQDGLRYRISTTTCPFLRLPTRADPDRLGSMRNRSHFAFPASGANLDPSTQCPHGTSKSLLNGLGRMSERVVLHIFDFVVVTYHIPDSETASTSQDFPFSINHLRTNTVCLSSDPQDCFWILVLGLGFRAHKACPIRSWIFPVLSPDLASQPLRLEHHIAP
jgi:hypothetical protein